MDSSNEVFTSEEKEILSSYVSNTDRSIFALTNLPEVIKGALFSRYSRSTLGLRSLLLRDFIQEKDANFRKFKPEQKILILQKIPNSPLNPRKNFMTEFLMDMEMIQLVNWAVRTWRWKTFLS